MPKSTSILNAVQSQAKTSLKLKPFKAHRLWPKVWPATFKCFVARIYHTPEPSDQSDVGNGQHRASCPLSPGPK